ncbi:MAG TPA: MlaD family protein [Fimbriimonadaceae bacterium]|nr:MlaD family protein [Fimbriimonadaceae bacterium]
MQGAWKVGLFVLLFVGLLFGAYQVLGKSMLRPEVDNYTVVFEDATGIAEGAKVLLAGVKVGTVSKVRLDDPSQPAKALISIEVDKKVSIPKGSGVVLPGSLIGFGDNPLQIVPPSSAVGRVEPGSTLVGVRTSPLQDLLPDTKSTMEEVNKTLAATRRLIEDQQLKQGLENLLVTSEKTLKQFGNLAVRMDSLVVANQGSIQQAIKEAASTMEEVKKTTVAIRTLASDPQWRDKVGGLMDSLTATTKKADDLVANLNAFVSDPALKNSINGTLANTEKISESGTKIAANAEKIAANGVVVSEKAIDLANKASEILDEAKELFKKFGGVLEKGPQAAAAFSGIESNIDLNRETRPDRWRTDVGVSIPFDNKRIQLGLWDAFESNKLTVQLAQPYSSALTLRYGIYASKPGVGVDYRLASRLFVRGDLFDINNPRGDLRLRYEIGNGFYGYLGVDRLFDRNAATIGFGFRK